MHLEIELTKDAKKSLALLYRVYESRRKSGMPKSSAVYLDGFSDDTSEVNRAVLEDRQELQNAGLISVDIVGGILIKDAAIVYMESKTANTIKEWLSFGAQFIP